MNEPTAEPTVAENPAENIEKDNVEEVSNQSIDRGATEGEEVSEHDREGKRDVTPTRKAERKTKPRAGGSAGDQEEVMNRLAGAADKQKVWKKMCFVCVITQQKIEHFEAYHQ